MDRETRLPLTALKPAPWNPKSPISGKYRRGLESSLEHFGFRDRLKVWPDPAEPGTYFVLDGNQRLEVFRSDDRADVDCRVLEDLDEENARLFTAAFDRNHALFDEVKLSELAASLKKTDGDLKARLLRAAATIPVPTAVSEAAGPPEPPDLGPTVPVMFSLSREGYEDVRETILAVRSRLKREERLRAALHGLADREADDLVVELALRICET